jgi:cell division protein FtsN
MPKRDNGEFEVLLGNKQLLSIFFVVVILLGVFFTMGYILGRNSAPPPATSSTQAKRSIPAPIRQAERQERAEAFRPTEPAQSQQAPREAREEPKPAARAEPSAPDVPVVAEPAPGQTFLQVVAVNRPEAEVVADVLKQKGFRSVLAPVPDKPMYRVLVGPLEDADALAKTRSDLITAGFKPIVRKY